MMTTLHPLAADWLARVDELARPLPPERRTELLGDLREHLATALPPDAGPDEVRQVLARMGTPTEIVAAAGDDLPPAPPVVGGAAAAEEVAVASRSDRLTTAEIVTLVLLVLSGLLLALWPLAILAWVVAVVLLVAKDRWEGGENLVALLLPFGFSAPWVVVALAVVPGQSCTSSETFDELGNLVSRTAEVCSGGPPAWVVPTVLVALGLLLVTAIWGVVWLVRRLRRRVAYPDTSST